jgi:hypothetical protein
MWDLVEGDPDPLGSPALEVAEVFEAAHHSTGERQRLATR